MARRRRSGRKGRMPAALARFWAGKRRKAGRHVRRATKRVARKVYTTVRRRRARARRSTAITVRRMPMARRGSRRRGSRRSTSGPSVSLRGFTSKQSIMTLGGATAGLVGAPLVSIKLADAVRDAKTGKSVLDGPIQNAGIAAAVGVVGGLALRKVDKNAATGFFVGSTAGAIATGLVAYAKSRGLLSGYGRGGIRGIAGNDDFLNSEQSYSMSA